MILLMCGCALSDYNTVIKANWGFSLPRSCQYTLVNEKDSGESFHGDGIRYHVFSYEKEDGLDDFAWEDEDYSDKINDFLAQINVADEIDYSNCRSYYARQEDNSEIIILLDQDKKLIYVIESFI